MEQDKCDQKYGTVSGWWMMYFSLDDLAKRRNVIEVFKMMSCMKKVNRE